jgi:hypothetical protein
MNLADLSSEVVCERVLELANRWKEAVWQPLLTASH